MSCYVYYVWMEGDGEERRVEGNVTGILPPSSSIPNSLIRQHCIWGIRNGNLILINQHI